jgi:hypothetical protein
VPDAKSEAAEKGQKDGVNAYAFSRAFDMAQVRPHRLAPREARG